MSLVSKLVEKYFRLSGQELLVGGLPVSVFAERFGTPLFIYDTHVLDRKWFLLRDSLPSEFSIFYSIKANPHPALVKHFLAKGCGLEVASGGELELALRCGCAPGRIVYAGPGKTEAELELALTQRIGEIHVESLLEIQRVSFISGRLGIKARIAVRVNPTAEAQGGAMRMGGKPSPFGVDEERLDEALDHVLAEPALDFRGVHLYSGTQILDAAVLVRQYQKGLEIARRVVERTGQPLSTIDFGGGLGIPYFADDDEIPMDSLRQHLERMARELRGDRSFLGTNYIVEPGRYLVGDAGIYVVRVTDVKLSRGKKFVVVDGGMNHHLAASGNLGQVIKRNFPIAVLNKMGVPASDVVEVVGPLCTPLDVLARDMRVPPVEVGDLVGIFQSGAYARSASPVHFLSHPSPAEVLIGQGAVLIRPRGACDPFSVQPT